MPNSILNRIEKSPPLDGDAVERSFSQPMEDANTCLEDIREGSAQFSRGLKKLLAISAALAAAGLSSCAIDAVSLAYTAPDQTSVSANFHLRGGKEPIAAPPR